MIINILTGEVIFPRGDGKSLTHLIQYLFWLKIKNYDL